MVLIGRRYCIGILLGGSTGELREADVSLMGCARSSQALQK
jgi:hypothetical protein